jgi:hypothetical protein
MKIGFLGRMAAAVWAAIFLELMSSETWRG